MNSGNVSSSGGETGDVPGSADRGLAVGLHLLASTPDCIMVLSLDGRIVSMNAAGQRLMQVESFTDIELRPWSALWPQGSRTEVDRAMDVARAGHTSRFSDYCPTLAGEPRWWDVVVSPVFVNNEAVNGILVIARDVSAQKVAEQSLRSSEQRFRALADNIAQFAWMADKTGFIFWYNRRWFDYTGTTLEEMQGWGWRKVHHPDHVGRVVEKFSAHLASGKPWEDEFPLRGADGQYRWFLSRAMPISDENGEVALWCGTNTDVTEQREAARRLRQKARLIELSHEAIFVWSFDKGIQSWNRGCRELYGFESGEALGRTSHDLLQTRHGTTVAELEHTLRSEGRWSGEILHRAKSGEEVWVESRQELIDAGDSQLVLETNRDVTAKRKADQMARLLLGEVVHRVKNTLAVVQAIAWQTARNSRNVAQFLDAFDARLQSLSTAHNLLTATSWSGAGLGDVIATQIGASINAPDGGFRIEGPPVFLPAQAALQLSLIFFELAANARKYGALSVGDGKVHIAWSRRLQARDTVDIVWRESGGPPVVPPRARGFGLTLIQRTGTQPHLTCEMSFLPGGVVSRITVTACEQPADEERCYFDPLRTVAAAPAAAGERTSTDGTIPSLEVPSRRRVLIVEDEPLIAMDLEQMLEASGFTPLGVVTTIDEALAAIETMRPDIVVLDGSLNGEPVDSVANRLDALDIPFVMVTGFTQESLFERVRVRDIKVLRKPIDRSALISGLAAVALK